MTLGTWLILVPAIAAILIVAVAWQGRPGDKLGPVNWSFNDSWASNLTVVLALFDSFFVDDLLPESGTMVDPAIYSNLAILFAALVIVGPFIYTATSAQVVKGSESQRQGYVWTFAVSAALILWAVLGQLSTTFVLSLDLLESDMHKGVAWTLVFLAGTVLLAALAHSVRSVRHVFQTQRDSVFGTQNFVAAKAPSWRMP